MIKVISFDIGNTIYKLGNFLPWDELIIETGLDKKVLLKTYKDVYQIHNGSFDELLDMFCSKLNIKKNSVIINFFIKKFKQEKQEYVDEKIVDLIKKLKSDNYIIILVSNSSNLFSEKVDNNILKNVDHIFYSYDLGYTKDDSELYRIIENKLGFDSSSFVHIGDHERSDYSKPIENGWNAILYNNDKYESVHDLDLIYNIIKDLN